MEDGRGIIGDDGRLFMDDDGRADVCEECCDIYRRLTLCDGTETDLYVSTDDVGFNGKVEYNGDCHTAGAETALPAGGTQLDPEDYTINADCCSCHFCIPCSPGFPDSPFSWTGLVSCCIERNGTSVKYAGGFDSGSSTLVEFNPDSCNGTKRVTEAFDRFLVGCGEDAGENILDGFDDDTITWNVIPLKSNPNNIDECLWAVYAVASLPLTPNSVLFHATFMGNPCGATIVLSNDYTSGDCNTVPAEAYLSDRTIHAYGGSVTIHGGTS